jgi:4a-hydroxytetrahydrobiopterin dehydratase
MVAMARPEKLAADEIDAALGALAGWSRRDDEIEREFECASFPDAIAFVVRVGFLAEAANHHPDLDVRWRKVRVALTTHDAGGLTQLDFDLAGRITEAFGSTGSGR